jgi:signal transduction histidine kinase
MHQKQGSLPIHYKIGVTVDNVKKGSLIYLLLPLFSWTSPYSTDGAKAVSLFFILIILVRFLWIWLHPDRQSKKLLWGLYFFSGLLCLAVSALGALTLVSHVEHAPVLFTTMLIATFTWGVMISFSIEPWLSLLFGALILLPYTVVLARSSGQTDGWIVLASSLFLLWNLLHVKRSNENQIKLFDYESDLRFQENRLRGFINSLPGYVSWLDQDLLYIDANNQLIDLVGIKKEELIGTKLGDRNHGDPLVTKVKTFIDSGLEYDFSEISILVNGEDKHFLTTMARHRLKDSGDQYSILSLDVTSLKRKELEIEKKRQQLSAHERFTALGEIAGGIAHEINNPLAIIVGKTDLLIKHRSRGTLTDEILDRQLEGISNTSQRIARIVNSLKILLRDGVIENIVQTSVAVAVEPMMEMIQTRLDGMRVKLIVERQNFDARIFCGIVELGQVIMNLIVNSAQAVELLEERWVRFEVQSDEQKVYLIITDSGNGITPETQKKLFQPFFTTKAPGVGTGIGLSLSKELMRKQQGDLYYDGTKSHTTFVLELVRAQGGEEAPPQSA